MERFMGRVRYVDPVRVDVAASLAELRDELLADFDDPHYELWHYRERKRKEAWDRLEALRTSLIDD